jgi:hypothetical protein
MTEQNNHSLSPEERLYCEPDYFEGIDAEREKFEAWAIGKSGPWLQGALERDEFGYRSTEVREHWSMWAAFAVRHLLEQTSRPKTCVKVADVTQLQRDLARLAAGGDSDVAAACVRAQAVIEGLLSGLDVEQMS